MTYALIDELVPILVTVEFLPIGRSIGKLVNSGRGGPPWCRALHELFYLPDRLQAGRGLPHHICTRSGRLDVDVHLRRHGVLVGTKTCAEYSALVDDDIGAGTHWGNVYVSGALDGFVLGKAHVGHVVGLGCAVDLGVNFVVFVSRIYCLAVRHRRPTTCPTWAFPKTNPSKAPET